MRNNPTPWMALPGRDHLGIGRYWHFTAVIGWFLTGMLYAVLLAGSAQWRRLIPTSWEVFPGALDAALTYLRFEIPHTDGLFNPLPQLAYAAVVFVLSPIQILTGVAMSPAVAGRFPWYTKLFGGRQAARSLHFIGMVAFLAFTIHHVAIVIAHGCGEQLAKIVLGITSATPAEAALATWVGLAGLAGIIIIHIGATIASLRAPRRIQHLLKRIVDPVRQVCFGRLHSRQCDPRGQISAAPRPNGRPPCNDEYQALLNQGFEGWRLEIDGLAKQPQAFTLDELRALPQTTQITKHNCIQGWSYIAEWKGVRLEELLRRCQPRSEARYLLFETFDEKWEDEGHGLGNFYTAIDVEQARQPHTVLAYGMNGQSVPVEFGAPLRLRLESQLGFKMAKDIRRLVLIDDYRTIGAGHANWRADYLYYSERAPI